MSERRAEESRAYWPGDLIRHGRHTTHVLILSRPIVPDVFLGAGVIPAGENGPGDSTVPFYLPEVDGLVVPTLVRAYRSDELGAVVAKTNGGAFDLACVVLLAALEGRPL